MEIGHWQKYWTLVKKKNGKNIGHWPKNKNGLFFDQKTVLSYGAIPKRLLTRNPDEVLKI